MVITLVEYILILVLITLAGSMGLLLQFDHGKVWTVVCIVSLVLFGLVQTFVFLNWIEITR